LVHPTQGVEAFGNISSRVYAGHSLTSMQNFTEIVPKGNPQSGAFNARGVSKQSVFGRIEGYIS